MIPYLAVIAAMMLLPQAAIAGDQFPHVLVSVPPLKPYTDAILSGAGTSQSLLRTGQDPHDFAMSPSQAEMLDHAEILIVPTLTLNPMLQRLAAKNKHLRVIELAALPGANALPYAAENPWVASSTSAASAEEEKPKPDAKPMITGRQPLPDTTLTDPHFWLDPERMAALARPVALAIAESSPTYQSTLTANADLLATHLRRDVIPAMKALLVPRETKQRLDDKRTIPFITYHAAYQYFLSRFALANDGAVTVRPEDYLGAKSLNTLLTTAKNMHIQCFIGESENTLVKRLAALSGAKIVILSPEQTIPPKEAPAMEWLQNDYDRLLYKTAKSFGDCL